jgi:hypothetical protein
MTDYLRVNDTLLSWNSCRFIIAVQPYRGIKSLDFSDSLDAPYVYGSRRDGKPIGTTSGKYTPGDIKLVTLRDTADDITTMLTALALTKGGLSYGDARFPITVQADEIIPSGVGVPVQTAMLETCRVIGVHDAHDEGSGELVTEFTLRALSITRNGKSLWSLARSVP